MQPKTTNSTREQLGVTPFPITPRNMVHRDPAVSIHGFRPVRVFRDQLALTCPARRFRVFRGSPLVLN